VKLKVPSAVVYSAVERADADPTTGLFPLAIVAQPE
jgi:hypothetical protein